MVMGRDSPSEGRGFKSRHCILDGHFFTYICCKNCNVCLKRPKINEKEAGVGPFFKKTGVFSFYDGHTYQEPTLPIKRIWHATLVFACETRNFGLETV